MWEGEKGERRLNLVSAAAVGGPGGSGVERGAVRDLSRLGKRVWGRVEGDRGRSNGLDGIETA